MVRTINLDENKLLLRPDEVESRRHTGGSRYPVSESNGRLDPGVRWGDEFTLLRASSIDIMISLRKRKYWIPAFAGMTETFAFVRPDQ